MEEAILRRIKSRLSPRLYRHSLGASRTAGELAKKQGLSYEKAVLAGLLHDYAREMEPKDLLSEAKDLGLPLDHIVKSRPCLLHGPVGVALIKKELNIKDSEILEAIHCHTLGKKFMSSLARVVYVADIIEPSRDFPGVERLRSLVFSDFNKGLIESVESTFKYLLAKRLLLHPLTLEFWNELIEEEKK